jgi:hypothetical protein
MGPKNADSAIHACAEDSHHFDLRRLNRNLGRSGSVIVPPNVIQTTASTGSGLRCSTWSSGWSDYRPLDHHVDES